MLVVKYICETFFIFSRNSYAIFVSHRPLIFYRRILGVPRRLFFVSWNST